MQAPSQESIKKRLSLSPVHIEFKKKKKTLLVLPHLCRNIVEPLPYFDLVCVCLRAFRPVGVDPGLSGVSLLLSHLPITMCLFFLSAAAQQLPPSVCSLSSLSHIWRESSGTEGHENPKRRRPASRERDLWLASISELHRTLNSAAFEEGGCEAGLLCAADPDLMN